jgi:hypothetical protein
MNLSLNIDKQFEQLNSQSLSNIDIINKSGSVSQNLIFIKKYLQFNNVIRMS